MQPLPAASLIHHWTFDEGSGAAVNDSIGSADMSLQGGNTGWSPSGKLNGAYVFSGSNHAVTNTRDQVTSPTSAVAIAGWFRTTASTNNFSYLFQVEREYGMRIRQGQLQLSFSGSISSAPRWGTDIDDGLWHHFAAQNNGNTTQLYIDGQLVGSRSETLSSLGSESKNFSIASKQSGQAEFAGSFDDIRYYAGTLTLSEIESLAQTSNQPPKSQSDSYTEAINETLIVAAPGVLANDTESDGDTMTAILVSDVQQGSLNLSADGSLTYTPPNDFVGVVEFTYQAVDVDGASNTATVTLTVLDPSSSLTPIEIVQIETDLGITLSQQEILDLSALVKPQTIETWRNDANLRIEAHRKANMRIEVVDQRGTPVSAASVNLELQKHAFKFGGVVTVMDLTDASANLSDYGGTTDDWKRIVKALFNSVGLNNGFKPKITGQHAYIPNFMTWSQNNDLDVRAHLLLWPGSGDIEAMDTPDAISGVDYGAHLSISSHSAYANYDVTQALETYKSSAREQADKDTLQAIVDAEIQEWVSQWDVYEWDVLNETINNALLMEILGFDQMAEWFSIADSHKVNSDAKLFINDYQVPSAKFTGTSYESRRNTYFNRIDQLIVDGAAVDGIGFQSRFKFLDGYDPAIVYSRLEEFAIRYPTMDFIGTEFEVKDNYDYFTTELIEAYDESTRAQVTEEMLTTYFSHAQVTGMNAWDVFNHSPDGTEMAYSRSMVYYGDESSGMDGPILKLNALVWYYLHRIRYHTDSTATTDSMGQTLIRGYKGEYALTVSYQGQEYHADVTLLADGSSQVVLPDVALSPINPTEATLEYWPFNDLAETELTDAVNIVSSTKFHGTTPTARTDGSGSLTITQDMTKTSGGVFLGTGSIGIGSRSTGVYELEYYLSSVSFESGDHTGANVAVGFKDSANGGDFFRLRLNKVGGELVLNTYFDSTYTAYRSFSGQASLDQPLKIRAVVDLNNDSVDIYSQLGDEAESSHGQSSIRSHAVWDQITFSAFNNSTDWGVDDIVRMDYLKIQKVNLDNYSAWMDRIDWSGELQRSGTDDPDGDSLPNIIEFALGGDPTASDATNIAPQITIVEGHPHYSFNLAVDTVDFALEVLHSEDLHDWTTMPPTTIDGEIGQQIQIPILYPNLNQCFNRLSSKGTLD